MHFTSTGVSFKLSYASSVWQQEPAFYRFLVELTKVEQKPHPQKLKLWDWSLSSASGWGRNLPLYSRLAWVGSAWLGVSRTGCHPDVPELLAGLNPGSLMALLTVPFSPLQISCFFPPLGPSHR